MISTLLLALTISATPPADRCAADISRAEASAFEATRVQHECMDPAECQVADELVTAAQAQLDAIAGQIRCTMEEIDQRAKELRASCSDSVATELAVRALGEARKHLLIARDIVQIEER